MERMTPSSLATQPFLLLCAAMFLGYANQWVLTPIIPLYVEDLGGSAFVAGLALLAFSVPSFTVRPMVGHLADKWSAAGVLLTGLALLATGTLLFLLPFLAALFIGNFVRGVAWAGVNTGGYTTLATAAPQERRGEAAGYYTSVTASVTIAFPALGLWLMAGRDDYTLLFALSALLALLGVPVAWRLARMQERSRSTSTARDAAAHGGFIERGVLIATGLNLCQSLAWPSVMAFLPLYARSLGIENIGWFYILAGTTSIIVRPVLGKKSDAIGRGPAIAIGLGAQLVGLLAIVAANDIAVMLAGGFFTAIGMSMIGSTTTALAMDLANPVSRGRAMATYSISYQLGAGVGSLISGAIADFIGLRAMYVGSIVITAAGFALLASAWKLLPQPAPR
jgi:MFS family permease